MISTTDLMVLFSMYKEEELKKIIVKAGSPQKLVYLTLFARKGKRFPKQLVYATQTKGTEYVVFPWDKLEHQRLKKFQ